jgi:hypothetical protein
MSEGTARARHPLGRSSSPAVERIARWQELTLRANLGLEADRLVEARRCHMEALAVAEALLDEAVLGNKHAAGCGLLLFGSSSNSMVGHARRENDVEMEGILLYRIVERFIDVAWSARAPLRFRSRTLLHLKVASEALYAYFERRGMWDAAAAYSERANATMFEVRRLEALAREPATSAQGSVAALDVAALVRSVRIEVKGASPLEAAPPRRDGVEPDDVLRVPEMK